MFISSAVNLLAILGGEEADSKGLVARRVLDVGGTLATEGGVWNRPSSLHRIFFSLEMACFGVF